MKNKIIRPRLIIPERGLALGHYIVRCLNKQGRVRWEEEFDNLVVNEGLDYLLDSGIVNGTQITTWYIGLLATSPSPAAGWTDTDLAAVDFVDYSEGTLQTYVPAAVSGQSTDNSANTADFSIDTNSSVVGGAFLISTNAKATPAGTLYSAGAFTGGDKNADSGDTLQVTATFTQAAA